MGNSKSGREGEKERGRVGDGEGVREGERVGDIGLALAALRLRPDIAVAACARHRPANAGPVVSPARPGTWLGREQRVWVGRSGRQPQKYSWAGGEGGGGNVGKEVQRGGWRREFYNI